MKVNKLVIDKMQEWLQEKYLQLNYHLNLYLIGSILISEQINDVDIVILIKIDKQEIKTFAIYQIDIKKDFLSKFNLKLHITSFTDNEIIEFKKFMSINNFLKLI